jgi:DnaD/phage-associated family protein
MFSKKIIGSARFMKMPVSSRELYFHLGLNADDDGVVEAYTVLQTTGATEDDLRVLMAKGFIVVLNEDLVSYITDWNVHNTIRADRKVDSIYKPLLLQIVPEAKLIEPKPRADTGKLTGGGQAMDVQWTAQVKLSEDILNKDKEITTTGDEVELSTKGIDLSTLLISLDDAATQHWNRRLTAEDVDAALPLLKKMNNNFGMLEQAMEVASQYGERACNWNYVSTIVNSWIQKGYKSEEDVMMHELSRKSDAYLRHLNK